MISIEKFYKRYSESFDKEKCYQIRIETGEEYNNDYKKVNYIHKLMEEICNLLFCDKDLYIILFIWDKDRNTKQELISCGFEYNKVDEVFNDLKISDNKLNYDNTTNTEVSLLYFKKYDYSIIKPIVQAIAGYEILVEPSANISAYFINFKNDYDVFVNLYDDRGIEILTTSKEIIKTLSRRQPQLLCFGKRRAGA